MLEGRAYVPLLHLRLAEVRALTELPVAVKNVLLPIIRLRPWLNSKDFSRAFEKVTEAFPGRFYGADLDSTRFLPDRDSDAYEEFRSFFDETDGFANYYGALALQPYAVPVLRTTFAGVPNLDRQVDHIAALGRGVIVRIQAEHPIPIENIVGSMMEADVDNRLLIVDGGWGRDILTRAASCTAIAQAVLAVDENAEIVIGAGSFPESFAKLGEHFTIDAFERPLFNEVRRQLNAGRIVFGDWASTRPPKDPVPMRNIPRIDVAERAAWESWRSGDGENYQALARQTVRDRRLGAEPDLWGEYMIVSTAQGKEPSIKSPAMAAAVRINLHMTMQATFDNPDALQILDEPVGDDL